MLVRPLTRPLVRPLTRRVTQPGFGWSPRVLFAAGEQGAWYDPSDLSTLFQDSAGTTPVTALGQPVGLMLDKSKGLVLGAEICPQSGLFTAATGWTTGPAGSISGGVLWINGSGNIVSGGTATINKWYEITVVVADLSGGSFRALFNGGVSASSTISAPGTYVSRLPCSNTGPMYLWTSSGTPVGSVTRFSVRELPGNHASQPTATARPTLQAGNKIDFDGVDDKLTTTFPDLGTAVTIVRSVPGTGASILTGQTIGAGARDDSTDHHGLLIINRALTAPETTLVTKWANLRAGI